MVAVAISRRLFPGPLIALATAALALAGCAEIGATLGAGANRVVTAVAGSPNAEFLGPRIAKQLDEKAEIAAAAAQYRALEYAEPGKPITWLSDHVYGTVTPGPYVSVPGHDRCREYSHTIYLDARPQVTRSVACRGKDGTWQRIGPMR